MMIRNALPAIGWFVLVVLVPVGAQETLETPEMGELSVRIAPAPIDKPLLPQAPVETLIRSAVPIPQAPVPEPPIEGVLPDPNPETSIASEGVSRSLYVTGEVGTVNINSVFGDVEVFRLGDGPQYRFGFNHFRADGLDFREPGTGYFQQNNALNGWVSVPLQPIRLEVEAEYQDRQIGLQGKPKYYAANFRTLNSRITGIYTPSESFRVQGAAPVTQYSQVLSVREDAEEAPKNSLIVTEPEIELTFDLPRLQLTTSGYYTGVVSTGLPSNGSHRIGLGIGLEGVLQRGVTVYGRFDTQYRFSDQAYFPFVVGLNGSWNDRWAVTVEGGGEVTPYNPVSLWDVAPATPPELLPSDNPYDQQWYADANIGWTAIPDLLRFGIGGTFRYHTDLPYSTGYSETIDSGELVQAGFGVAFKEHMTLVSSVSTEFSPWNTLTSNLRWQASWLDRLDYSHHHEIGWNTEFRMDPWSVTADVLLPIYDEVVMPSVDVIGGALLGDDLRLNVFVRDALSPLLDQGRASHGDEVNEAYPLIGTGFEAGLSVRVTF